MMKAFICIWPEDVTAEFTQARLQKYLSFEHAAEAAEDAKEDLIGGGGANVRSLGQLDVAGAGHIR